MFFLCVEFFQLCPEDSEEFIDYLTSIGRLDEAAIRLAEIVNNEDFVSKHGKSNHQLWNELCDLISKNPQDIKYAQLYIFFSGQM